MKSCCIIFSNEKSQSEKTKIGLLNLLVKLINEEDVTNIYLYDIDEYNKWLMTSLAKLQLVFPIIQYTNIPCDFGNKLCKHKSPVFNDISFREIEELCLEHFLNHSYKNLKYCQIINKSEYVIFVDFKRHNNPLLKTYYYAIEKEDCKVFEVKN